VVKLGGNVAKKEVREFDIAVSPEGSPSPTVDLHNGATEENQRATCDCRYMRSSVARSWLSDYEE
jgi:hypothetical protein